MPYLPPHNRLLLSSPIDILKQYWGYSSFRPMQAEIIQSALDGNDTLALLPTGGGKSVCFQVPALVKEGVCLVVSPLIALMKDQVAQLQQRGIKAAALYSGMSYQDIDRIVDNAVFGHLKFLYLSPERLQTDILKARLPNMPINFLAIDEAHCVSQWGYDFRPPYLQIAEIRELLAPNIPIIALTATATPEVVEDIQDKLVFRKPPLKQVLQSSFQRSNLAYVVRQSESKRHQLFDILQKVPGAAVVYVRNRRKCKEIAVELLRRKIPASFYHAGLDMETRSARQDGWVSGKIRVIVATNAFGMGIDKADVRLVVHLDLPDSLEAYFQEAGRAGRDGEKAYAVLLYHPADKARLERNFQQAFPEMTAIRRVYRALGSYFQLAVGGGAGKSFDFDIAAFTKTYQLDIYQSYHCLKALEQAGWIVLSDSVYMPATIKITVSKETLYDYQLKHPKLDRILKIILRTYQGAFSHPVQVREKQLASFLKIPFQELRQGLLTMDKAKVIRYSPIKDEPQLIFIKDRIDADRLALNWEEYNFRKDRHEKRIHSAIGYVEKNVCRSKQLLFYFGEQKSQNCGVCDVCLNNKRNKLSASHFSDLEEEIQLLLKKQAYTLKALVNHFDETMEKEVLEILMHLLDEGLIIKKEEMLFLAQK